MAGIYTVTAEKVVAGESKPDTMIKLVLTSPKVAIDIRDQLIKNGYVAIAQLVKELD